MYAIRSYYVPHPALPPDQNGLATVGQSLDVPEEHPHFPVLRNDTGNVRTSYSIHYTKLYDADRTSCRKPRMEDQSKELLLAQLQVPGDQTHRHRFGAYLLLVETGAVVTDLDEDMRSDVTCAEMDFPASRFAGGTTDFRRLDPVIV